MNDQMLCGKCGLQWDVNDPEPPHCNPAEDKKENRFNKLRKKLGFRVKNN